MNSFLIGFHAHYSLWVWSTDLYFVYSLSVDSNASPLTIYIDVSSFKLLLVLLYLSVGVS